MLTRVLRLLGLRRARRASTHLTPGYEARRITRLRECRERFLAGKVGAHFEPAQPKIKGAPNA